jgi:hypothetical protein
MTNAAALRIILDFLHAPYGRDRQLAIVAAEVLWRGLETGGPLEIACLGVHAWAENATPDTATQFVSSVSPPA